MARPKCFDGPKERLDNEWYTLYSSVEYIFNNVDGLNEYVKDKILYLPCDTENSNIYKYLINNKEELQIKEILRTSDDYYKHHDLYRKADIVITNPPFTKICKWILFLYEMNKEFIIWAPFTLLSYKSIADKVITNTIKIICSGKEFNIFLRPDGSVRSATDIYIFSNIKSLKKYSKKFKINLCNTLEYLNEHNKISYYNGIPIIHNIRDFPINYYDYIYISFASFIRFYNMFDIFEFKSFRNKKQTDLIVGKWFFRKDCYLVKLKHK